MVAWMGIWIKRQILQITFDRKMRSADLTAVDKWLRLFVIYHNDGIATHVTPTMVCKVPLTYSGSITQAASILSANGACEEFKAGQAPAPFLGSRFVLMMRASTSEIMSDEASPVLLDPDFAGTTLNTAQLDQLWAIAGGANASFLAGLAPSGPNLPSGDGTAGGQFHSFFAIDKQ